MNDRSSLSPSTQFVHHKRVNLPKGNLPLVSPIYQSVKFTPANMSQLRAIMGGGTLATSIQESVIQRSEN